MQLIQFSKYWMMHYLLATQYSCVWEKNVTSRSSDIPDEPNIPQAPIIFVQTIVTQNFFISYDDNKKHQYVRRTATMHKG
jgi:hypothetical protein